MRVGEERFEIWFRGGRKAIGSQSYCVSQFPYQLYPQTSQATYCTCFRQQRTTAELLQCQLIRRLEKLKEWERDIFKLPIELQRGTQLYSHGAANADDKGSLGAVRRKSRRQMRRQKQMMRGRMISFCRNYCSRLQYACYNV